MSYRVVVIEDEERILRNICTRIERLSPRFRVEGRFTNPLKALDYLDSHPADVVFTDIRMPELDGLALLSRLDRTRIPFGVIISSYQDFAYAKSAIRLRVSEYLLKPFLDDELLELLQRLERQLDELRGERLQEELQELLHTGRTGALLPRLCAGRRLTLAGFCMGMESEGWEDISRQPAYQSLTPQMGERLILPALAPGSNLAVCLFALQPGDSAVQQMAGEWSAGGGTAVYTEPTGDLSQLPGLYRFLRESFPLAVYPGRGGQAALGALPRPRELPQLQELHRQLAMVARSGADSVREAAAATSAAYEEHRLSQYELRQQLTLLLLELYRGLGLPVPDAGRIAHTLSDLLGGCASYSHIGESIAAEALRLMRMGEGAAIEGKDQLALAVKEYLDSHTDEQVGLPELVRQFHFSQTYIVRSFREAFGASPIEYMIRKRIERAKELLRLSPNLTVRQVAELLGYNSQYYFSRAFKQAVGISPAEYRQRAEE